MKFTSTREALLPAIQRAAHVAPANHCARILSHILVSARDGEIDFRASNLDLEISGAAEADVANHGVTAIEARKLLDIVRSAPAGAEIAFELGDRLRMGVRYGASRFTVPCLGADNFPEMEPPTGRAIEVDAKEFLGVLERVGFAAARGDSRPVLNGVHVYVDRGMVFADATDGVSAARSSCPCNGTIGAAIFPRGLLGLTQKVLSAEKGAVTLKMDGRKAMMIAPDSRATIMGKALEGPFVAFGEIVPRGRSEFAAVDRSELRAALTRVAIVADEKVSAARLHIDPERGKIFLSSTGDAGEAESEVDAEITGKERRVGFNCRRLIELVNGGDSEVLYLSCGAPAEPILVLDQGEKLENPDALHFLMALRDSVAGGDAAEAA